MTASPDARCHARVEDAAQASATYDALLASSSAAGTPGATTSLAPEMYALRWVLGEVIRHASKRDPHEVALAVARLTSASAQMKRTHASLNRHDSSELSALMIGVLDAVDAEFSEDGGRP